jgi:hypothetical protein
MNNQNNDWNKDIIDTIRIWKQSLVKASFVYQLILEKYQNKLNNYLIMSIVLSSSSVVLSGISTTTLAIDSDTYRIVSLVINIVLLIMSILVAIISGIIKIYKLNEMTNKISNYVDSLDKLIHIISLQLSLPYDLRVNGIELIKKKNDEYLSLMDDSPQIDNSDYIIANKKYYDFLQDDNQYYQYFKKIKDDDGNIEIV